VIVLAIVAALIVVVSIVQGGYDITSVTNAVSIFILLVPIYYFWQLFRRKDYTQQEQNHIRAFVWIFLGAAVFWMIFEQAGSTLTVFADDVTQLTIGEGVFVPMPVNEAAPLEESWTIPASWLQSVNPLFIIIFAPFFSAMWMKLADRAPRTPIKFAIALLGVGISFAILAIPMARYENSGQMATIWWLLVVYLLQTWSELLLSPTGLSATSKLAPGGAVGQFLALWFLATSVGTTVGGQIARVTADNPVQSFLVCGSMAIGFGVIVFLMSKKIAALMGHVH